MRRDAPDGSREVIDLCGHGRLEILAESDEVVFFPDSGGPHHFRGHPLLRESGRLCWATSAGGEAALIGRRESGSLHLLDLRRGRFRVIPTGERLARAEQLQLVASGSVLLALTENGVIAVDPCGRELWRIGQTTWGWRFVGESDGLLWFEDVDGNLLSFDRASGEEA